MTGWLGSGVKGKMDRIFKPSPGKILVSDKLGNAVESGVSVSDLTKLGNSGGTTNGNENEPFVKVYETVLTEATELNELWILPEDMGLNLNGEAYIDVSVYVLFDSVAVQDITNVRGLNFLFGQVGEAAIVVQTDYAESDLGRTYINGTVYSQNGLLVGSYCVGNYKGMTGFFPRIFGASSPLYPQSPYFQGVTVIRLQLQGETSELVFPEGTQVMVYARRKVNIVRDELSL